MAISNQQNVKQVVPFLKIVDMERSLQFYLEGVGFSMTKEWVVNGKRRWCWLELGGAALMLQDYTPDQGPTRIPTEKHGVGVSITFQCEDALALYHQFLQAGLSPAEPFVGNAMWVTSLRDPDGYYLEFESSTSVPEETKFTDWKQND
jgi:lactoylglutathione lyase